jgi:hypothetical protein
MNAAVVSNLFPVKLLKHYSIISMLRHGAPSIFTPWLGRSGMKPEPAQERGTCNQGSPTH